MSNTALNREDSDPAWTGQAPAVQVLLQHMRGILSAAVTDEVTGGDAEEILAYLLDATRSWPARNPDADVSDELARRAIEATRKRALGAPIQYCVGVAAFRHLIVNVDERVLVPRSETETLVEHVLTRCRNGTAIDVGTGSGAIALALASEGSFSRVIATDVSSDALAVAEDNTNKYSTRINCPIEFFRGSGLDPVRHLRADVVVSNPPYIAFEEEKTLPRSVRDWEPKTALFAADDGMAVIADIVSGAGAVLVDGGLLAVEIDSQRAQRAAGIAIADGRYGDISILSDLTGRDRFLLAYKA